ncbi:NAD(+) diphosphatase [Rudaeicoccus suwonensis]|nr:NAD(+) diphosphatase [Rudaeicoccus suwonensis]
MPATSQTGFDLILSRTSLDRAGNRRHDPQLVASLISSPTTRVLEMYGERVRLTGAAATRLPLREPRPADEDGLVVFLGEIDGADLVCVIRDRADADDDQVVGLRQLGAQLHADDVSILVTAAGIANWHATQGFCSFCGHRTVITEAGWARHCNGCGKDHYPRTDPAVIMSVIDDDDRILLARGHNFAGKGMSVLAGFVEPGESLEAAVAREVMEEVGVPITDARFLDNQPWPFPSSLMIGYTCHATETELTIDPGEIARARWFSREELATCVAEGDVLLSPRLSIARHLIEHWYGGPIEQPAEAAFLRRS